MRFAIASFYGLAFSTLCFALAHKIPLEYAYLSGVAAIGFSAWLEAITVWILRQLAYSVRLERQHILVRRIREKETRAIPWSDLGSVNLPSQQRFLKNSVILQFDYEGEDDLRFDWQEIKAVIGDLAFINLLHAWAPQAVIHGDLPGIETKRQGLSYTELWLNDLGSSRAPQLSSSVSEGLQLKENRYIVVKSLAHGGQGYTYLAEDGENDNRKQVVLKEYIIPCNRGQALQKVSEHKLEKIAHLLHRLHHPSIVRCLDRFVENGRGYMVFDYVQGKTLKELVELQGAQPDSFVISVGAQVCDILSYLHGLKPPVVHRDLSPDNLMLQEDGTVKLVDFDIAQELVSTRSMTIAGKHRYIPPEQFRGQATPQSDIYALGGTLFFLCTGLEPEPMAVSRPSEVGKEVADSLESAVSLATQLEPERRFHSAEAMKERLLAN